MKKNQHYNYKGLSLLELLIVMSVLAIVMSLIIVSARELKYHANLTFCTNNMHQISIAMAAYYNDYNDYPSGLPYDTLPNQLSRYISNSKVFICPQDDNETIDSYSQFYVYPGQDFGSSKYILGCPRHKRGTMTSNIFSLQSAQTSKNAKVTVDNQSVSPGTTHCGTMVLEDGTTVNSDDIEMQLVQSFNMNNGTLYTIIRVPDGDTGSISVEAAKGTNLEIVTPSLIAAVRGTRFTIEIGFDDNLSTSNISVTDGVVEVQPIRGLRKENSQIVAAGRKAMKLTEGNSLEILNKPPMVKQQVIDKRVEKLYTKILRGKKEGENTEKDIALYEWLSKFSTNNLGSFVQEQPAYEYQSSYSTAKEAKKSAKHAKKDANKAYDNAITAKNMTKRCAKKADHAAEKVEKATLIAQRKAAQVLEEISNNNINKAIEKAQETILQANKATEQADKVQLFLDKTLSAQNTALQAKNEAEFFASIASTAATQAAEIAANDDSQTKQAQKAAKQAQKAAKQAQKALEEYNRTAAEVERATIAADLAREKANLAEIFANNASEAVSAYNDDND